MIYTFLLKSYLQKNDRNTMKFIFCDVIGCPIGLYNFKPLNTKNILEAVKGFVQSKNKIRTF